MLLLDTNILIYYLRGTDQTVINRLDEWRTLHEALALSIVTYAEILSFPSLTEETIQQIENVVTTLTLINIDPAIARLAAFFRRNYPIKLPDALIAATAFIRDCPIVTRNARDFRKIPGITIEKL